MVEMQQLKYAVEVERTGSILKAAEKLYVSQPYLSKAIRSLENEIGIEIFNRTSRGVVPTKKGEDFLAKAKEILASMEDLESRFLEQQKSACHFEFAVPIACYISHAFVKFMQEQSKEGAIKADYRETNTMSAIEHVADHDCNVGIIRYPVAYEEYFLRYVESKDLVAKPLWSFDYQLVICSRDPLAQKETITPEDLKDMIEISHGDPTVPTLSASAMMAMRQKSGSSREIVVYERQSQFELLCEIPGTYMWASPTPRSVLNVYPLVERTCRVPENHSKDVLIYRNDYHLSSGDRLFIEKIRETIAELQKYIDE